MKILITDKKDQVLTLEDENTTLEIKNNKLLYSPIKGKELGTDIQGILQSELNAFRTDLLVECEKTKVL